jgi:hypothetical protein
MASLRIWSSVVLVISAGIVLLSLCQIEEKKEEICASLSVVKKEEDGVFRVLWFSKYVDFVQLALRMDFSIAEALNKLPNTVSVVWGPRFPGYDSVLSLRQNIETRFGTADYFDLMIPVIQIEEKFCPEFVELGRTTKTVVAAINHEMRNIEWTINNMQQCGTQVKLFPYLHEVFNHRYEALAKNGHLFFHYPFRKVKEDGFCRGDPYSTNRSVDVLLIGTISEAYPLRARVKTNLLPLLQTMGIRVYQRPIWAMKAPLYIKGDIPVDETQIDIMEQNWRKQADEYQREIMNAKVVICTSSMYHYTLMKYPEVASLGTFIVTDPLWDRMDEFHPYVGLLDFSHSDTELATHIFGFVNDAQTRMNKAAKLQRIICDQQSEVSWRKDMKLAVQMARSRQWGLYATTQMMYSEKRFQLPGYIPADKIMAYVNGVWNPEMNTTNNCVDPYANKYYAKDAALKDLMLKSAAACRNIRE